MSLSGSKVKNGGNGIMFSFHTYASVYMHKKHVSSHLIVDPDATGNAFLKIKTQFFFTCVEVDLVRNNFQKYIDHLKMSHCVPKRVKIPVIYITAVWLFFVRLTCYWPQPKVNANPYLHGPLCAYRILKSRI